MKQKCIQLQVKFSIDNHSSGYLGMVVQYCVRTYLGPHCILAQKQYCQKLMAQLDSTAFLPLYVYFEAIKLFMKNSVTVCKSTFYSRFVLTD